MDQGIPLSSIPQGPGSRLDADTVDGFQVTPSHAPGKLSLVTTDNNAKLPTSVMPGVTKSVVLSGHTFTFVNGVLTNYV